MRDSLIRLRIVLAVFVVLAGGAHVAAQETDARQVPGAQPGEFFGYSSDRLVTPLAGPPPKRAPAGRAPAGRAPAARKPPSGGGRAPSKSAAPSGEFSTGRRVGAAFMNPLLGLGSYTMGDWVGGLIITLGYGAAAGLIVWDKAGLEWGDEYAGIPGGIGIGLAGATTIFGILRPIFYHRSGSGKSAAVLDGANIAVIPDASGIKAVRLSYSFQF